MDKTINLSIQSILNDLETIKITAEMTKELAGELEVMVRELQKLSSDLLDNSSDNLLDTTNLFLLKIQQANDLIKDTKEMIKSC